MMSEVFLPALRAGTTAFISIAPVSLEIRHYTMADDGAGGKKRTYKLTREPQTFTLIEPSNSGNVEKATIAEGTNTTFDFILLGEHDALVDQHDEFTYDGFIYKVENMMIKNGYEVRARVLRVGAA